uniref:Uncharacterized protein n=1 Tax=Arundo donax TaxID=35708 RepID=A0A0A8ZG69_ARUDO
MPNAESTPVRLGFLLQWTQDGSQLMPQEFGLSARVHFVCRIGGCTPGLKMGVGIPTLSPLVWPTSDLGLIMV